MMPKSIGKKMRLSGGLAVLALLVPIISFSQVRQPLLCEGDVAPPLDGVKWLRGKPISRFEKGQVYVVVFGYIGCPPCRAAIPLMTELSRKYTDVTLLSIYVNEDFNRLKRYVEKTRSEILYALGIDGPSKTMLSSWVYASGEKGYPHTFVIDKNGVIVWIENGFPDQLEGVVNDVVNNSFNYANTKEKRIQRKQKEKLVRELFSKNEFETALTIIDSLIGTSPRNGNLYLEKIDILFGLDEKRAFKYIWEIFKHDLRSQPSILASLSGTILLYSSEAFKSNVRRINNPDLDLVIAINEFVLTQTKDDLLYARSLGDLAKAYSRKGDFQKAIELLEGALKLLDKSEQDVSYMTDRLTKDRAMYYEMLK